MFAPLDRIPPLSIDLTTLALSSVFTPCRLLTAHDPQRTACSESDYSFMEFLRELPDNAACLDHLTDEWLGYTQD